MVKQHNYSLNIKWTGNKGEGTTRYDAYDRSYIISGENKVEILGSADEPFRGDITKYNPEDLLLASLSSCHMLSYLYLCSLEGIVVTAYTDNASGTMIENATGGGSFKEVTLNPIFYVSDESMVEKAIELHHKAHEICYIANSVNFDVKVSPTCLVA